MTLNEDLNGLSLQDSTRNDTNSQNQPQEQPQHHQVNTISDQVQLDGQESLTPQAIRNEFSTPTTTITTTTTDDNNEVQEGNQEGTISDSCSNYTCKEPYADSPFNAAHLICEASTSYDQSMKQQNKDQNIDDPEKGQLTKQPSNLSLYQQETGEKGDTSTTIAAASTSDGGGGGKGDQSKQSKQQQLQQSNSQSGDQEQPQQQLTINHKSNWQPSNCCNHECSQCSPEPFINDDGQCSHSSCCCGGYTSDDKSSPRCHSHCDSMSNCSIVEEQLHYHESTLDKKSTAFTIGPPAGKSHSNGQQSTSPPGSPKMSPSISRSTKGRAPLPPSACHASCSNGDHGHHGLHGTCHCQGGPNVPGAGGRSGSLYEGRQDSQFSIPYSHSHHYHVCPQFNMYDYSAHPHAKIRFYQIGYNTNLKKPPENWQRMKSRYHAMTHVTSQKPRTHYRYSHFYGYGHSFWSYMSPLAMWPTLKYTIPTSNRSRKNFFSHYLPKSHGGMKNFDLSLCLCCVCCNCSKTNQTSCCCCYHCVHTTSSCRRSDILRMVPAPTTASNTPCPPPSLLTAPDDHGDHPPSGTKSATSSKTNIIVSILKKATGKGHHHIDSPTVIPPGDLIDSPGEIIKEISGDQIDEQENNLPENYFFNENDQHEHETVNEVEETNGNTNTNNNANNNNNNSNSNNNNNNSKSHSGHTGCCFHSLKGSHQVNNEDDEDEDEVALADHASPDSAVPIAISDGNDVETVKSEQLIDAKERGI